MRIKHRHFPYPVLSPFSNDITGDKLIADITVKELESEFQFNVNFQLNNETLLRLIENNQAVYAVHLECSSTMKRFFEISKQPNYSFKINHKLLNNIVEINFFIVADKDIPSYYNTEFHEDFDGVLFNIQKGDLLAFAETVKMNIRKEPLAKTNSIFELSVNPNKNAPLFEIDFNEKITISLHRHVYEEITNLRGYIGHEVDDIFISMYYLPALIEALYLIHDLMEKDELYTIENSVWYQSIVKRLEKLGENIEELNKDIGEFPNLAMKILDNNKRTLSSIHRIFGIEEGEVG
jgi:hypothetical protein